MKMTLNEIMEEVKGIINSSSFDVGDKYHVNNNVVEEVKKLIRERVYSEDFEARASGRNNDNESSKTIFLTHIPTGQDFGVSFYIKMKIAEKRSYNQKYAFKEMVLDDYSSGDKTLEEILNQRLDRIRKVNEIEVAALEGRKQEVLEIINELQECVANEKILGDRILNNVRWKLKDKLGYYNDSLKAREALNRK